MPSTTGKDIETTLLKFFDLEIIAQEVTYRKREKRGQNWNGFISFCM